MECVQRTKGNSRQELKKMKRMMYEQIDNISKEIKYKK